MKTEAQRIAHYELRQRLGQDSTGETWRAYDESAQRVVILKLYRTDPIDSAETLTTYLSDVERVSALHHPHIARIYDMQLLAPNQVGNASSLICIAMECVEGETLADYIKNTSATGKMPSAAETVQLFSALAQAIDSAHQRGIIHGNLKATNILLNQSAGGSKRLGTPLVSDFGQTKFLARGHSNEIPFYLAPEQVRGSAATAASDIYALGILLYEFYTGMPPFRGNRPIAVMMQHVNAQPTPPDLVNPAISPALTQI